MRNSQWTSQHGTQNVNHFTETINDYPEQRKQQIIRHIFLFIVDWFFIPLFGY
jgi:hypothetical protein